MPTGFRFWGRLLSYIRGLGIPVYPGMVPRPLPERRVMRFAGVANPGFASESETDISTGENPVVIPDDEIWSIEAIGIESNALSELSSAGNLQIWIPRSATAWSLLTIASTWWGQAGRNSGALAVPILIPSTVRRLLLHPGDRFHLNWLVAAAEPAAKTVVCVVVVYRWPQGMCPYLS